MVAPRLLWLVLFLALSVALSGCTNETLKEYERATSEDDDTFQFAVDEGTDELRIVFSTKGSPRSEGEAQVVIAHEQSAGPSGQVYVKTLQHGAEDEATIKDPRPGNWRGFLSFDDGYTGPASVKVSAEGGGALFNIGGSFWDIAGVVIGVLTFVGGGILVRRRMHRLNREMERIEATFRDLKADPVQCRAELEDAHEDLRRQLVQGRLKESHFLILEKRIERHLVELDKMPAARVTDTEVPLDFE